ncbi:putative peptidoglycan lipid II flippase [Bacillus sp. RC242]|uniref:murein biosynthesis integral membrane protein MurJ n=1 Tax=Bacillus sp. RC242 TaxID=3156286 RepID=UPI0038346785
MKLISTSLIMLLISLFSAILGLLRETLLAKYFGISIDLEAFIIASFLPLTVLPAIGKAITTSLIPVYLNIKSESEPKAIKFYYGIRRWLFKVGIIFIMLIGIGVTISTYYGMGIEREYSADVLYMTLILLPTILILNLHGIERGRHQAESSYLLPSISNLSINVFFIIAIFVGAYLENIYYLCYGLLIACFFQMYMLLRTKRNSDIFLGDKNLDKRELRAFMYFFVPALISSIAPTFPMLLGRFLTQWFESGALVSLNYAFTISRLPVLLLAMSSFSILYTLFNKSFIVKDYTMVRVRLINSINFLIMVLIPSTVFIICFSEEIVRVLFERGAFDQRGTELTAKALVVFIMGLFPSAIRELLFRFCFATANKKSPFISSIILSILSVALTFILCFFFKQYGVPLASLIANVIAVTYLLISVREYIALKDIYLMLRKIFYILGISIFITFIINNGIKWIGVDISTYNNIYTLVILIVVGLVSILIYVVLLLLFKNEEVNWLINIIKKKITN